MSEEKTCCFIGHRKMGGELYMEEYLRLVVEFLITESGVSTFLFGSKSEFNNICLKAVTEVKEKYPYIKRIYIRAEYPVIGEDYKNYLLKNYEDTYYPERVTNAGSAVYIERNFEMINKSDICVFYFNKEYSSSKGRSGTHVAFDYAVSKKKEIYNAAADIFEFSELKTFALVMENYETIKDIL